MKRIRGTREKERRSYSTARAAAQFFGDAREQGWTPTLLTTISGFEVVLFGTELAGVWLPSRRLA